LKGAGTKFRKACAAALLLAALWAAPAPAHAQCPLCRSALEKGDDRTASTMNLAILVLLVPPVSIFCTIFAVAYRKRRGEDEEDERP
jgi:heme/copper-type cytochrome/quinol oxidase subunit 2